MNIYFLEEVAITAGAEDEYAAVVRDIVYPLLENSKVALMRPVGTFRMDITYGSWPTFLMLWSFEGGWETYTSQYQAATKLEGQLWNDKMAIYYTNTAGKYRQRSFERVLAPLGFSPQPAPRPAVTSPNSVILQQEFTVVPGRGAQFAKEAERSLVSQAKSQGLHLELFAKSVGRPLEYIAIWSLPSLDAYAKLQMSRDPSDETTFLPGMGQLWPYLTDVKEKTALPMNFSPMGGVK